MNLNNNNELCSINNLELIPVSKWNQYFDYPSVGAIRQLIFYNTDNFEIDVIRKIGKRQYIKHSAFLEWVEKTNKKAS